MHRTARDYAIKESGGLPKRSEVRYSARTVAARVVAEVIRLLAGGVRI